MALASVWDGPRVEGDAVVLSHSCVPTDLQKGDVAWLAGRDRASESNG